MALIGTSVEQQIWNYFKSKGMTDAGVAGLMGNLYAESALNPTNLQNSYEKKLGYTDAKYTFAVNNGLYNNFVNDSAGTGWHNGLIGVESNTCLRMLCLIHYQSMLCLIRCQSAIWKCSLISYTKS